MEFAHMDTPRPCAVAWREPDGEPEATLDRDDRVMRYASVKGSGRARMAPQTPGGHRNAAWGGGLRRVTAANIAPARQDENLGRGVPIGYARYASPVVDPHDYKFYRIAGWRVAVLRTAPEADVHGLLRRIFYYGPQPAGYVRLGDTLVPAALGPGDRAALAQRAIEYEPALSP
jgi:hypothetical protein